MRTFRFRAQAAIDQRQREYDDARRVLARATLDLRAVESLLGEAEARLTHARAQCAHESAGAIGSAHWQWHRVWMLRLERERSAYAAEVSTREREVAGARGASLEARNRLKVLERFRDKARCDWEQAVAAEEHRQLDMLATLRHVAALRTSAQRSKP